MVMRFREYQFRNRFISKDQIKLPISDTDIIDFVLKTKCTVFEFPEARLQLESANQLFRNNEIQKAKALFEHVVEINLSVSSPRSILIPRFMDLSTHTQSKAPKIWLSSTFKQTASRTRLRPQKYSLSHLEFTPRKYWMCVRLSTGSTVFRA